MSESGRDGSEEREEDSEETWVEYETPDDGDVIDLGTERREQRRHVASMQSKVLVGVGFLFCFTLLTVVLGRAFGALSEALAEYLIHTIMPVVLGSGATIVGALFQSGKNLD
ncbi:hypothetical protein GCM10027271_25250 [Saccharopolyspora gloriosae]